MNNYTQGLKNRIDEIKAELETNLSEEKSSELQAQMEELQAEYDGLLEMAEDIEAGNFESITEKPEKK